MANGTSYDVTGDYQGMVQFVSDAFAEANKLEDIADLPENIDTCLAWMLLSPEFVAPLRRSQVLPLADGNWPALVESIWTGARTVFWHVALQPSAAGVVGNGFLIDSCRIMLGRCVYCLMACCVAAKCSRFHWKCFVIDSCRVQLHRCAVCIMARCIAAKCHHCCC